MGYCCVRSRSRCHVSPILMFFLLLVADFYIGHTHQLRGSDLSTSFVAVLVPTASLIGRPWNCFMFLASWVTFIILCVPRYFPFCRHVHGVIFSVVTPEGYSISDVVSQPTNRFSLSITFSHPFYLYLPLRVGGNWQQSSITKKHILCRYYCFCYVQCHLMIVRT
jgi:hypothetical protein